MSQEFTIIVVIVVFVFLFIILMNRKDKYTPIFEVGNGRNIDKNNCRTQSNLFYLKCIENPLNEDCEKYAAGVFKLCKKDGGDISQEKSDACLYALSKYKYIGVCDDLLS